ncbi:MAG: asparagine synthase (glutamine-hydrolyzing) [Eubacterium sp.]|jgi:asparagine synthase (glutamine-hydrolysing)|nr:asparagine synthase (glutamine-hydrolyzing) [Eubacterium sp.]
MCSIAGFYHPSAQFLAKQAEFEHILQKMCQIQAHRGPDDSGTFLSGSCGLSHTRLSIIDLKNGKQPMTRSRSGHPYHIVYNGEIYNTDTLRQALSERGVTPQTSSDTEIILLSYLTFGPEFVKELDGIFAFAIYDERHKTLTLYRDSFGVKPLFYTIYDGTLVFSSELKGLFCFPGIRARLDAGGLNELFGLGPARTPGNGVFKDIFELKPGTSMTCSSLGFHTHTYFQLASRPHEDSYEDTIEKTRFLVTDAIKRQMVSDVPVCTFLSGGVDSSLVSAVCAKELKAQGQRLATYSFDFTENDKYFQANSFQPSLDRPYVDKMAGFLHSDHRYLECGSQTQADLLYESVDAHDLPCMADVDSSLLYFCGEVSKNHKVVLTGECADEVFGGYPWFHKESFLTCHTFPWTPDLSPRTQLLNPQLLEVLDMEQYVQNAYETAISEIQLLPEDNETEASRRRISYLNIRFFMQTLLNRMDRTSMHSGLEARVPFADRALVTYVFNIPWEMKAKDGIVKNVLRQAARTLLPDEILFRKKSPYPKTYHPAYEKLLAQRLTDVLAQPDCPLVPLVDKKALMQFLERPKDYGKPWYGQLMAGPQMTAYLLQTEYFLRKYHVEFVF